jgi:hypothetical protein
MAVTGKGAEGVDLAARAMALELAADHRRAERRRTDAEPAADELVPEPRDP